MRIAEIWQEDTIQTYMAALKRMDAKALPETVAHALNSPAKAIEKQSRKNAQKRLIIRTPFTINSIKQDRHARGGNIDAMYSRVGSVSTYLHKHDKGETVEAKGQSIPIPVLPSRGGNIRRRVMRKYAMDRLGNIDSDGRYFMGKPKGGNRPAGIYERYNNNKRLRMLRLTTQSSVAIPGTNWYSDAVGRYGTAQFIRAQFIQEADRRLREVYTRMK